MIDEGWYYEGEFTPQDLDTSEWCPQSKELLKAAEILEKESGFFSRNRVAPSNRIAADLSAWFVHKARLLERYHQLWEYEQAHPEAKLTVRMPVKHVEESFSDALKTAREVIRTYERQAKDGSGESWISRTLRKVFTRSGNRQS
jgi:hypothetical protein